MKKIFATAVLVLMSIYVSLVFFAVVIESKEAQQSSKSTIYTVKCVDDILTGEFVKVNDKYFRPDSSEPTWIPLSQCGLEPKKQTRN